MSFFAFSGTLHGGEGERSRRVGSWAEYCVSALYGIMYSGSEGNWCDVVVQCLYFDRHICKWCVCISSGTLGRRVGRDNLSPKVDDSYD